MLIAIDGLSQCEDKRGQNQLLQALFTKFDSLQRPIKILISSRPTYSVRGSLDVLGLKQDDFHTLGDSLEDRRDITRFLRSSLRNISLDARMLNISDTSDSWPSNDTLEKLVDLASGHFSVAAAVVAFLEQSFDDPEELLADILGGQSEAFQQLHSEYLADMDRAKEILPEQ